MKCLKFRYISARNFLPFGPEGIEIYFDDYGQVVLVNGTNLDTGTEQNIASNGSGKSSIVEIISYAFYGQTIKKPKKIGAEDVVNKTTGRGMVVEVQFDDYRIVRSRETTTNKVELWHSPNHLWDKTTKISKGKGVQDQIEKAIGISHTAFCNIVIFDDSNAYSFLELETAGKRDVVENLLGLDKFRAYHSSAKEMVKTQKNIIKDILRDYEYATTAAQEASSRIVTIQAQEKNWRQIEEGKINALSNRLEGIVTALSTYDNNDALTEYNVAQTRAEGLSAALSAAVVKKDKLVSIIQDADIKMEGMDESTSVLVANVRRHQAEIERLESVILGAKQKQNELNSQEKGAKCPTCYGVVDPINYGPILSHEENVERTAVLKIEEEESFLVIAEEKLSTRKTNIAKMKEGLREARQKLSVLEKKISDDTKEMNRLLKLPAPQVGEKERSLKIEITTLEKQINEKQLETRGRSPYHEILTQSVQEKADKVAESEVKGEELKKAEEKLKYYDYWVEAFGDKGIRKHVVDGIIPALNSRIAYWLQFLIDSKIKITFDNQLNETIERNGIEAYYHTMSNGEKRRINLAVSQAFAYVMMLNSGHCPSVVFLDEITGGGIDTNGVIGIYNMIFELAKERQVFVTTHNQALLQMLQGCESIELVKKGDITTLVA